VLSPTVLAPVSRRDRLLIAACLFVITALAWAYLVHLAAYDQMMAQMGMAMSGPWTATDVLFTFAMWAVMMAGMMTGSAAPVLLLFAKAQASRATSRVPLTVLLFGLGYLTGWAGFSAIAALAQWALHAAAMLSSAMAVSSGRLAGVILIGAGVYQLTPFKGACLTHCQSPLGFLMTHWRSGAMGALRMGWHHGTYCLGCCWALMCVLFAVGVMNLAWVAALTVFVLLEKIGPAGALVSRVSGTVMIAAGTVVMLRTMV
jgi:predicted metal-binding membrane protein